MGIRSRQRQCKPPRNGGTPCGGPVPLGYNLIFTETAEDSCNTNVACPGNYSMIPQKLFYSEKLLRKREKLVSLEKFEITVPNNIKRYTFRISFFFC